MKITLPKLELPDLELTADNVQANRQKIASARVAYHAALKTLSGLDAANAAMCSHPDTVDHYDPGYAGDGYSHTECHVCGATKGVPRR